ncbi:CSS-motif domain-containing protein [Paraburkholderia elongata]|uniref:CSS-motif domain-containing protein n=1 Tax=Paraburkholderia elongata TaxID=2675747 RepID=UPI001F2B303E|nr:CSS-motif domain-containing protein [Paraburkholderia elongata]
MPATVLWRESVAFRRRTALEMVLFVAVILLALTGGYHIASERAQVQQKAVAQDIADSIDRIVTDARTDERKLMNLAGRPCPEIQANLTLKDVFIPYRGSAMMVQDGNVYCSTVLGAVSIPLATYLVPSGDARQIAFLGGTRPIPDVPVMAIYAPVDHRHGILYIARGRVCCGHPCAGKGVGRQERVGLRRIGSHPHQ